MPNAAGSGVSTTPTTGGDWLWANFDRDGDEDVLVANQSGQSRLYRNDAGLFQQAQEDMGLVFAGGEVAAVFGDWDGDADLDLFVSNELGANHLYRNEGGISFSRATDRHGLFLGERTVGAAFFDYDNDGDLDLATTALSPASGGDQLYQNMDAQGRGPVLLPVGELLDLQPESSGRALSFADWDRDGDLDLLVADTGGTRLYRNRVWHRHWLQIALEGMRLNNRGLGARIELIAGGRRQYREIQSGYGYASQVAPQAHFGLGSVAAVDSIRVVWPDGAETALAHLETDQRLRVSHPRIPTGIWEEKEGDPQIFALWSNYPNPFNARTTITYQLPDPGRVELTLYNILGQPVRHLVSATQRAGTYRLFWDGTDDLGTALGSGIYIYRLTAGDRRQSRRLVLLK